MSYEHAKEEPIAEAEVLPANAEEDDEVQDPRLFQLYLDSDSNYRWYEEDEETDVAAPTLLESMQAAEEAWDGFQIVECRGRPIQPGDELDDSYAADEIEELEDADE